MENVKWQDVRKELFTPEVLELADQLLELEKLCDGLRVLQEELEAQKAKAEGKCEDCRLIQALGTVFELRGYLVKQMAQVEAAAERLCAGEEG